MNKRLWSIQIEYSDNSYLYSPIVLSKLVKFIKMRREEAGNTIRTTKPIDMWLLEYAIHTAKTSDSNKHICKITVETGGE